MRYTRRTVLQSILATIIAIPARFVFAKRLPAFDNKYMRQALDSLYGDQNFIDSTQIEFTIPEVAENGAFVPINIKTDLSNVETIGVFAEKNPRPLVALFTLHESALADVSVRIRLAETTQVFAIVEAGGKRYGIGKHVQVTIGGCGT